MRAGIALILLVAALPVSPAAARSPFDPGARVFTLAGGGNHHMQSGMPAGRLSLLNALVDMPLAALADGSVAVADDRGHPGLVGLDGRVRPLPPVMESRRMLEVRYLATEVDGSLLASDGFRYVYRLRRGAAAWERAFDLRRLGGNVENAFFFGLVGLPSGGFAVLDNGVWRISDDGSIQRVKLPAGTFARGALTALRDGSLVIDTDRGIIMVAPDGSSRVAWRREFTSFAQLTDGTLLRTGNGVERLTSAGTWEPWLGTRPKPGLGDGDTPGSVFTHTVVALAGAPDGALLAAQASEIGGQTSLFGFYALPQRDGTFRPDAELPTVGLIRVVVAPGTPRALAAIAPTTFATFQTGRVGVVTTFAGRASLVVRRQGHVIRRATAEIAAGSREISIEGRPPRGLLRLEVTVDGEGGRVAIARMNLVNLTRLTIARARYAAGGITIARDGNWSLGRCHRGSAKRVQCQLKSDGRCASAFTAVLRPDGIRYWDDLGRRRCRRVASS